MLTLPTNEGFIFMYQTGTKTLKNGKVKPIIKEEIFSDKEEAIKRRDEIAKQYPITMDICECFY